MGSLLTKRRFFGIYHNSFGQPEGGKEIGIEALRDIGADGILAPNEPVTVLTSNEPEHIGEYDFELYTVYNSFIRYRLTLPNGRTPLIDVEPGDDTSLDAAINFTSLPDELPSWFELNAAMATIAAQSVSVHAAAADPHPTYFNQARADARYFTQIQTNNLLVAKAPLASPALTGTPTAPTAAPGTNTTQIATAAFVQSAVAPYQLLSGKNAANGYAGLDSNSKIDPAQLPPLGISSIQTVADQSARLVLSNVQEGDAVKQLDTGETYLLAVLPASTNSNWIAISDITPDWSAISNKPTMPAGAIVGTTDAQTITNKTISGASNTLSNIAQSAVTNLTTDLSAKANLAGAAFTDKVSIRKTTNQFSLEYDGTNKADFTVSATGILTITPSGAGVAIGGNLALNGNTPNTFTALKIGNVFLTGSSAVIAVDASAQVPNSVTGGSTVFKALNSVQGSTTLNALYNFFAASPSIGASSAIANSYGIYVAQQKTSLVTNGWGVYQVDAADKNYFNGVILVNTLTDDGASKLQVNGAILATGYKVGVNQIIGARKTGWSAPTGTRSKAAFDPSTVSTQSLAQFVAALYDDLSSATGHGLIN